MTKAEAIKSIQHGDKVTHSYFSDDEWISMKNGMIIDENNYTFHPLEFWSYRTLPGFNTGWSITN